MKIGIVGFAGSGKTTLFNALTGQSAPVGYGNGKVNLGAIKVPDPRVDRLAQINNPKKTTYAEINFADVPGGRGTSSVDPQTLSRIREMDALVQVVRGFANGTGTVSPASEIVAFEAELAIADLQLVEKRVERLQKDRSDPRHLDLLKRCLTHLGNGKPLRDLRMTEEERARLSGYACLSLKPLMVVLSQPESKAAQGPPQDIAACARDRNLQAMALCGAIEAEIAALTPDDQTGFLADLGLRESASARFIRSAFAMLDLIAFLTHGKDECRSWALRRGSTAVQAARTIHSDLARGFIRAEIIAFRDFDVLGSEAACRDEGKLRIEGKDYVIQDGDICHVRFNV